MWSVEPLSNHHSPLALRREFNDHQTIYVPVTKHQWISSWLGAKNDASDQNLSITIESVKYYLLVLCSSAFLCSFFFQIKLGSKLQLQEIHLGAKMKEKKRSFKNSFFLFIHSAHVNSKRFAVHNLWAKKTLLIHYEMVKIGSWIELQISSCRVQETPKLAQKCLTNHSIHELSWSGNEASMLRHTKQLNEPQEQ